MDSRYIFLLFEITGRDSQTVENHAEVICFLTISIAKINIVQTDDVGVGDIDWHFHKFYVKNRGFEKFQCIENDAIKMPHDNLV